MHNLQANTITLLLYSALKKSMSRCHLIPDPQVSKIELQVGSVVSLPYRVITANRSEVSSMIGLANANTV